MLITDRKSYMSFRLVPKSVTLNDLERRNGSYFVGFFNFLEGFLLRNGEEQVRVVVSVRFGLLLVVHCFWFCLR